LLTFFFYRWRRSWKT